MTRPAKQTFVPSGIDQAQFPVFFARNGERNAGCLENRGDRELRSLGVEFSSRDAEYMAALSRERPRRGTGRMSDRARAVMVATEKPNYRHCRLLRARRERPRHRRAAKQRDELAPSHHSITSSARASRVGGTSIPSAFVVLRLITSSYLVGACTGRSPGFSPFRMRST